MFRLAHVAAAQPEQCCPLPAYSLPRVNSKTFSSSSRDITGPINTSISHTATTMAEQESVAVFGQGGGETEVSCVILHGQVREQDSWDRGAGLAKQALMQ